jgi:GNAT superfamily N-acetyltransferase
MKIELINAESYKNYSNALLNLYIDTFSSGESFQYHPPIKTRAYLDSIFVEGYGIVCLNNNQLTGAILLTPFHFDKLIPLELQESFDIKRSIYVAEMMVEKSQQGKGLGKKLFTAFFNTVNRELYSNAFIRVWQENKGAIALYKKVGFNPCASIVQQKLLADKSKMFSFEKIYLHQRL